MAASVSDLHEGAPLTQNDLFVTVKKVTLDASYPTGGEGLTLAQLGFALAPDWVEVFPYSVEAAGYSFVYDLTNKKLLAYWGDNNNAADGPLTEVAAATDLSAVVVVVKAYGRHFG